VEEKGAMFLKSIEKDGGQCDQCNVNNSNANQAWDTK
jgi:hypothetical protein